MTDYLSIDTEKECRPVASSFRMYLLGLLVISPSFLYGLNLAYPSIALSQMELSLSDASWFGSIAIFASPLSSLVVGHLIDAYGRKTALLYGVAPSVAGWTLLAYGDAANVPALLVGQALNGMTVGAVSYPMQVYAGECVVAGDVRARNTFMVCIAVGCSFGTTSVLLLANVLTYRAVCVACGAFAAALTALFALRLPESPTWLRGRGRRDDAERALLSLGVGGVARGGGDGDSGDGGSGKRRSSRWSGAEGWRKIARPDVRLPLALLSTMALLHGFSGGSVVITYLINVIEDRVPGAGDGGEEAARSNAYSLLGGLAMCVGSLASGYVLPRIGVKPGLLVAYVGTVAGMVALAWSSGTPMFLLQSHETAYLVRVAAVTLVTFATSVSLGPLMAASGDLFPVDAKGFASVPDVIGYAAIGLSAKWFPYAYHAFAGNAYLGYALVSGMCAMYAHCLLPEVVGRTLDEINSSFGGGDSGAGGYADAADAADKAGG